MEPARDSKSPIYAYPTGRRVPMSDGTDFWWPCNQAPASAKVRAFRDHWLDLRGDRTMPPRGALDPLDVTKLLPHIVLVDVLRDPLQFRYRLIGTFITSLAGRDATGRFLDRSLYGRFLEAMTWPYQQVVETRAPVATLSGILFAERDWHCIENVFVPFSDDAGGDTVAVVAVCADVDRNKLQRDLSQGLVLDWRS